MRRIAFLGLILFAASCLLAQPNFLVEGYITSVQLPTSFKVGGRMVVLTRQTSFGPIGADITSISDPARMLLRIGAYVEVEGSQQDFIRPIAATVVFVRDDRNEKLSGIGVITRVVAPPPEPIYEADGYLIRISETTHLSFAGDLSSISEITDNTWIHFTGKRNASGILEASHAQFIPAKPTKFKAIKGVEIAPLQMRPACAPNNASAPSAASNSADGASMREDEQVKIGLGRWRTIPADQPLQQRVHRIGMALVPAYQRQMDDSDSSKIHFRFFAVDDKKMRGSECLPDGVVLVSTEAIQRLPNDDQLAAVLAASVACQLQRQTARSIIAMRTELGIQLAADVAEIFFPPAGIAGGIAGSLNGGNTEEKLFEERLRLALALMGDAGYDPWQAPEAWRLLDPKKLPANLASLEYPDASCYQISVLNLQYPRTPRQQKQ